MWRLGFFVLFVFFSKATFAKTVGEKQVMLWTYYDFLPFTQQGIQGGLVDDIADLLTRHSEGKYVFTAEYLPRKRVDMKIKSSQLGMVTLVNSQWFPSSLVASKPLLRGYDVVVSPKARPINQSMLDSSTALAFIGVTGHKYPMIERAIENGEITRFNVSSLPNLLNLIAKKRGDFAIVPGIIAEHYNVYGDYGDSLNYESIVERRYTRRMLFNANNTQLKDDVDRILNRPQTIDEWHEILRRYNLQKLAVF